MMNKQHALLPYVFSLIAAGSVACTSDTVSSELAVSTNAVRYTLTNDDGFTSFYSGPNIANVIAKGHLPTERDPNPYNMLRVPSSKINEVRSKASKTLTISLEDPAPFDIRLVVNTVVDGVGTTVTLKPGDPWLSGFAQIVIGKDGSPGGLFQAIKWTKYPQGNVTIHEYTTGTVPDVDAPKLKYNGPPNTWPPVPPSWK